jgi:hemolysin activation/secretion protein
VTFDPSAYLSRQELDALAAPLIGREVTIDELRDLVARINALYTGKGFATARAALPAQDIAGGIVTIRLIEGRIGQVTTEGGSRRGAAGARTRVGLAGGELADPHMLEQRLRRFNLNNDAQLSARLAPGSTFGATDLVLVVQEPKRISIDAFVDNGGFSSTGNWQQGGVLRLYRLLGSGDRLTGAFVHSKGVNSGNADYSLPIGRTVRLALNGSYGATHIQAGTFADLDVRGTSSSGGASVAALLHVDRRLSITATGSVQQTYSHTAISGERVIDNRAFSGSLGLSMTYIAPGFYTVLQQQIAFSPVDERISQTSRDPFLFRGSALVAKALAPRLQLQLRGDWQLASHDDLPGLLQYQIGGSRSSRAFSSGAAAGDEGLSATAELSYAASFGKVGIQPSLFVDHAQAGSPDAFVSLQSVGAGATVSLGTRLSVRGTYARGIGHRGLPENSNRAFVTANLHI